MQLNPDEIALLVPAFIGAGLVLLAVAAGVLVLIRLQYPAVDTPLTASSADERRAVSRGLRTSGVTVALLGAAGIVAGFVFRIIPGFGPASLCVPVSVVVDGLIFMAAARANIAHAPPAASTPAGRTRDQTRDQ